MIVKVKPCDTCGIEFQDGDELFTHGSDSEGLANTRCEGCEAAGKVPLESLWKEYAETIRERPYDWAIFPDTDGDVTIEYFGPEYMGDAEAGAGIWRVNGPIKRALVRAMLRFKRAPLEPDPRKDHLFGCKRCGRQSVIMKVPKDMICSLCRKSDNKESTS